MTGVEYFLDIFGNITIAQIVFFAFAIVFCWKIYKEIKKFLQNKKNMLIEKHEKEQEKEEELKKVLSEVNKYPQYREQSRQIQKEFRDEIDGLKETQNKLIDTQHGILNSLQDMKQKQEKRDRNKLQDRLLQSYRYYTDKERNPEQIWTAMEAQAFWDLFTDYEEIGGDGYMHDEVQPAMKLLKVVENK